MRSAKTFDDKVDLILRSYLEDKEKGWRSLRATMAQLRKESVKSSKNFDREFYVETKFIHHGPYLERLKKISSGLFNRKSR